MSDNNMPLSFGRFIGGEDGPQIEWEKSKKYREFVLAVLSHKLRMASTDSPELIAVYADLATRLLGPTTLELTVK